MTTRSTRLHDEAVIDGLLVSRLGPEVFRALRAGGNRVRIGGAVWKTDSGQSPA